MNDILMYIGLIVVGGFLFWQSNRNIETDEDDGLTVSGVNYTFRMIIGGVAALTGIILLIKELITLF